MKRILFLLSITLFFIINNTGFSQNYSLEFDGIDDYVDGTHSGELNFTNTFSFSCWIYLTSITGDRQFIFENAQSNGANAQYIFGISDIGKIYFYGSSLPNSKGIFLGETTLNLNDWNYISVTYDNQFLRIYLNGELDTSYTSSGSMYQYSHTNYIMGCYLYNNTQNYNGNLEELSVWNINLSQSQIQTYMCNPPLSSTSGLVGMWWFNEGTGVTVIDSSQYQNNGIIHGATWSTNIPSCSLEIISVSANPDSICIGESSQLDVQDNGGVGTITYQWTSNPSGFNSNIQNPIVYPDTTTWYIVTVSDNDTSIVDSAQVTLYMLPDIFNITGGGAYCEGGLGVDIGLDSSEVGISYELYLDGTSTGNIIQGTGNPLLFTNITQAGEYTIFGYNDYCSEWMNGVTTVSILIPYEDEEICMVTVDTNSVHNMIIWNKTYNVNTSYFLIYKESTQSGVYFVLDTVPFNNYSLYVDSTSNPLIKSDRYKISVIDSCENESGLSPFHKTLHLTVNQGINGWNLIWSHYEGFEFGTYFILRKIDTGNFVIIDSIQSTLNSYTDINPPPDNLEYRIRIIKEGGCNPFLSSRNNIYYESLSNIVNTISVNTSETSSCNPNIIYDSKNHMIIFNLDENSNFTIYDIQGRIYNLDNISIGQNKISLKNYKKGIYIVKVVTSNYVYTKKIIR